MILTSHEDMDNTDSKTGVWLGEFTDPYYVFADEGYEITLCSPKGGKPPLDPMSLLTENITASNRRFNNDEAAKNAFANTVTLTEINPEEYNAVFFPGGHGPMWDLAENQICGDLILNFLDHEKPVGAVCHGPAALLAAEKQRPGFLKGKKITGFTNTEETMVLRHDNIPYKLETRLKEIGTAFSSALIPYTTHTATDGWLVTGQNPASAGKTAELVVEQLKGKSL